MRHDDFGMRGAICPLVGGIGIAGSSRAGMSGAAGGPAQTAREV